MRAGRGHLRITRRELTLNPLEKLVGDQAGEQKPIPHQLVSRFAQGAALVGIAEQLDDPGGAFLH